MTLRRKSGLSRENAGPKRSKGLAKGSGRLKQTRRQKARVSPETVAIVKARQRGRCACGCGRPIAPFPIGYHHTFPKSRWPSLTDIAANIVGLSENCHANHETGAKRLSRQAVAVALPLIADGSMERFIERTYPVA